MPKRPSREKPAERKGSADLSDPPPKRGRKAKELIIIIEQPPQPEPEPTAEPPIELFQELLISEIPPKIIKPVLFLSKKESLYFKKLSIEQQQKLNDWR